LHDKILIKFVDLENTTLLAQYNDKPESVDGEMGSSTGKGMTKPQKPVKWVKKCILLQI
jgi:hypothetical protein